MEFEGSHDRSDGVRAEDEARCSDWMFRANAGDADTYTRLLDEIADVMERYLRRHFGDSDFIEDCVQECLLAIHRAQARTTPPPRPSSGSASKHSVSPLSRRPR